jgi:X-X-X-Leu-X-X-Gly heptad repeat protein
MERFMARQKMTLEEIKALREQYTIDEILKRTGKKAIIGGGVGFVVSLASGVVNMFASNGGSIIERRTTETTLTADQFNNMVADANYHNHTIGDEAGYVDTRAFGRDWSSAHMKGGSITLTDTTTTLTEAAKSAFVGVASKSLVPAVVAAATIAGLKSLSEETKKVEELDQIEYEFWQDEKQQIRAEQQAIRDALAAGSAKLAEANAKLAAGSAKLDEGSAKLAENHVALLEFRRQIALVKEALKQLPPSPQVFSADVQSTADKGEYKDQG